MRAKRLPRRAAALVGVLILVAVDAAGCGGSGSDESACAKPALRVGTSAAAAASSTSAASAPTVASGGTLYAAGTGFDAACLDGGQRRGPQRGIRLYIVQGEQRLSVAEVNAAGTDDSFAVSFGVPPSIAPRSARLVAQTSARADADPVATARLTVSPTP